MGERKNFCLQSTKAGRVERPALVALLENVGGREISTMLEGSYVGDVPEDVELAIQTVLCALAAQLDEGDHVYEYEPPEESEAEDFAPYRQVAKGYVEPESADNVHAHIAEQKRKLAAEVTRRMAEERKHLDAMEDSLYGGDVQHAWCHDPDPGSICLAQGEAVVMDGHDPVEPCTAIAPPKPCDGTPSVTYGGGYWKETPHGDVFVVVK